VPAKPRPPASLETATSPQHDLADEATYRQLGFTEIDLSGQEADSVEFEQCRFTRASLAGVVLDRAMLTDCLIENSDWANLKATKSGMQRVKSPSPNAGWTWPRCGSPRSRMLRSSTAT
jgi:uncharacterized protein YjbI with pentapeptide repeats